MGIDIFKDENGDFYKLTEDGLEQISGTPVSEIDQDVVNPNHYKNQCSLECIEAMIMAFGGTVVYDFCICNAWKYMWRYQNKNGKEDLTKARWYLEMAEKVDCDRTEHWNIETVLNKLEEKSHEN